MKKQQPTLAPIWKQVSSVWGQKVQSLWAPQILSINYSIWRQISLSVRVAGLLVLKCNFQKLAHPTVSENGVLHALILGSVPALLHQALHFCKQSPVSFWILFLPLLNLPNSKPRKAPGAPLSESGQIGSVCCVLRKVTSFRLMKQWQFQSA